MAALHNRSIYAPDLIKSAARICAGITRSANLCVNLLVPPRCVNCGQLSAHQSAVCAICWNEMRFIERPFCEIMGSPFSIELGKGTISTKAIADPPPFGRLRAALLYDDIAARLISRLKFSDRNDLTPFIANVMARAGHELIVDADIIIPLPLHWRRMHQRRFNQCAELARIIAKKTKSGKRPLPVKPMVLKRIRNTRQQIGLTQEARRRNVSGAFTVPPNMRPQLVGKNVLLVDDVYTTGASVKSATKALIRGGANNVDVLAFAKVQTAIM